MNLHDQTSSVCLLYRCSIISGLHFVSAVEKLNIQFSDGNNVLMDSHPAPVYKAIQEKALVELHK